MIEKDTACVEKSEESRPESERSRVTEEKCEVTPTDESKSEENPPTNVTQTLIEEKSETVKEFDVTHTDEVEDTRNLDFYSTRADQPSELKQNGNNTDAHPRVEINSEVDGRKKHFSIFSMHQRTGPNKSSLPKANLKSSFKPCKVKYRKPKPGSNNNSSIVKYLIGNALPELNLGGQPEPDKFDKTDCPNRNCQ